MHSETDQMIYSNFEMRFPFLADEVVDWIGIDCLMILVKLENGEKYIYNDTEETFMKVKPNYENEFGFMLGYKLSKHGMRQDELADRISCSRISINNYVTGRTVPSYYVAVEIAKALNCSLDDFRWMDLLNN